MGKGLQRSLHVYLSKLRRSLTADSNQDSVSPKATTTTITTSRLLSACKYPKTPSFPAGRQQPASSNDGSGRGGGHAATLSDVDRFLFENFNSLYATRDDDDDDDGDDPDDNAAAALERYLAGDDCSSPSPRAAADPPPDVRASRRFFVSPGTSNSLLEETRPSAASTTSSSYSASSSSSSLATVTQPPPRPSDAGSTLPAVPGDGVPVMTFSKDPYEDFRRSMQEMVEDRHADPRQPLDWDFMEELLICYLELNDRSVHRHILGAFTDIAVAARRRRPSPAGRRWVLASSRRRRRPPERDGTREEESAAAAAS